MKPQFCQPQFCSTAVSPPRRDEARRQRAQGAPLPMREYIAAYQNIAAYGRGVIAEIRVNEKLLGKEAANIYEAKLHELGGSIFVTRTKAGDERQAKGKKNQED